MAVYAKVTLPSTSKSCWLAVAGLKGLKAGGTHQKHTFTKLRGCDSTNAPPEDLTLCSKWIARLALWVTRAPYPSSPYACRAQHTHSHGHTESTTSGNMLKPRLVAYCLASLQHMLCSKQTNKQLQHFSLGRLILCLVFNEWQKAGYLSSCSEQMSTGLGG